jgi:HPt (histidine-containing phosphotransfer) domain-containing protein
MFIRELPVATLEIQAAFISGNLTAMHDTLHKLKASCGFLGVEHLLAACHRLDQTPCLETFAAFQNSAADTLTVIRASDD